MSDVVIQVEGLSKRYRLGAARPGGMVREVVQHALAGGINRLRGRSTATPSADELWALKDVSFHIERGQVVGFIGRNGAGKSTLLKVLSRITPPTTGRALLRGRVGSLLEVGTGFHPELTGRENIFLNGAILGMRQSEIHRQFDAIVAFAEVERFLDTPVKRYSSGMYVRLAFAVAAHLDPEILIVDEVLAVGDAAFQRKCLGKMKDVAGAGRTVLFVSHNMATVQALTSHCVWLAQGQLRQAGPTAEVVRAYLRQLSDQSLSPLTQRQDRQGSGLLRFTDAVLESPEGHPLRELPSGGDACLKLTLHNTAGRTLSNVQIALGVDNSLGQRLAHLSSELTGAQALSLPSGTSCVRVQLRKFPLIPGTYSLTLYVAVQGQTADWVRDAWRLEVIPGNYYGTGRLPTTDQGCLLLPHAFTLQPDITPVIPENPQAPEIGALAA